jgi:FAD/FMN-containing dehydrogenase
VAPTPIPVTVSRTIEHERAVAALRASYAAIPPGRPVRLAKRTSNLFRPRADEGRVTGLDTTGLDGVISIDVEAKTADVQGMCTYENLVAATLVHGLMPRVVPQLKTITLGGAVTGLGIEASSFRNGLPHESVLELDVLTGAGALVTASRTENADLFYAFPNSYGSLGYSVRLRIELEPVLPFVGLRHVQFTDLDELCAAIETISRTGHWAGEAVNFLDGVMFAPDDAYLSLGRFCATVGETGLTAPSNYTGQQIYYRSIRTRQKDCLTVSDYLWRWDTDWFWCSQAFGAQHPVIRRLWPQRYRRSDVYHRIIGLENRFGVAARIDRLRGQPASERVVQDVEVPLARTADFLRWFAANVKMSPIWLCPVRVHEPAAAGGAPPWPLYPMHPGEDYVNVGFWGTVPIEDGRVDGDVNRLVENAVAAHHGHKSLYSDAYYDEETFARIYGGDVYDAVKASYDPDHRLTGMYEKAVGRK